VARDEPTSHICLAGRKVSGDWPLIRTLKARHPVTLLERVEMLSTDPLPDSVRVLVLDAGGPGGGAMRLLPLLKRCSPALAVLLVGGALDQQQLATAFRQGVRDYFPDPYDGRLLAERVLFFCGRPWGRLGRFRRGT
jgi:DNA-binding response OmpR family regulator